MVVYACGNNTSKQICNDASQILCCPTQIGCSAVQEAEDVRIAFSYILWKVGRCWKLTGFKEKNSVLCDNIHPHWKLAVSENKKIAINECGSVIVYENGTSWKIIRYQHDASFKAREITQSIDTVDTPADSLASSVECRKRVKRKQAEDELTEDIEQIDAVTTEIKNTEKDLSQLQNSSGNGLQQDKESYCNNTFSFACESSNTTKTTAATSVECNLPRDYFDKVCVADNSVLSLNKDGAVFSGNVSVPVGRHRITDIAVGKEHYMALSDEGVILTWGSGMRGQLGNGNICQDDTPSPVQSLLGIVITSIMCGGWHSAALSDSGDVYVWGWNESGQLGFPTKTRNEKSVFGSFDYCCQCPVRLQDEPSQSCETKHKVTAGSSSEIIVKTKEENISHAFRKQPDKRINSNHSREVMNVQASPVLLDFWCECISIKVVACGDRHTLFLLDDRSVWSAGMNKYGQLGLGHTNDQNEPAEVPIKNVMHIYAGGWNSVFVTSH